MKTAVNGKIVLVTKRIDHAPRGGREMLSKLNHDALIMIFGDMLSVYELPPSGGTGLERFLNFLRAHIDGLTSKTIDDAINKIETLGAEQVFVDGSNLGSFISALKDRLKDVRTTCFFHNVEARFFWGAFMKVRSFRSLIVLVANYNAERKAVVYSDNLICLSGRDSNLLQRVYGRSATHICPMALRDQYFEVKESSVKEVEPFALFVGGDFYANRHGITWFVDNVVPYITIKLCIVGKGMEEMRNQLEIPGRVKIVGTVTNLAEWYLSCRFVIAPIFDGSGMKTKVAEALMFGKKVVGTPEAFSGYEEISEQVGWCCKSRSEFISAVKVASTDLTHGVDPELRRIYLNNYSLTAAAERLAAVCGAAL